MGGRPSVPINPDPGVWNPSKTDKHLHVLSHWAGQARRTKDELDRWETFRKYQGLRRENSERFRNYKTRSEEYLVQAGFPWRLHIDDVGRQRKIDDWKEYYVYEHRKLGGFEKVIQHVEQLPQADQWLNDRIGSAQRALDQHMKLLSWIQDQLRMMTTESAESEEIQSRLNRTTKLCHTRRSERLASKRPVPASHTCGQAVASRKTVRERLPLNGVRDSKVSKPLRKEKASKLLPHKVARQKTAPLEARRREDSATDEPHQCEKLGTKCNATRNVQQPFRPQAYSTSVRTSRSQNMKNRHRLISQNMRSAVGSPEVPLRRSRRLRQLRKKRASQEIHSQRYSA